MYMYISVSLRFQTAPAHTPLHARAHARADGCAQPIKRTRITQKKKKFFYLTLLRRFSNKNYTRSGSRKLLNITKERIILFIKP